MGSLRAAALTRVAWIVYGSLAERTGGTIYDALIVRGLEERGVAVEVFAIERGADAPALLRRLVRARPDVIVGDELCFPELAFVFPRPPFAKRLLLVHHLSAWEEELRPAARRRARFGEAIALRHADAVVATSQATRARLLKEGVRRPVSVVLPGADRLPMVRGEERGALLFVGAIVPRKRVCELVEAFASVPAPATLRLVGPADRDPAYLRAVQRAIDDLDLRTRVVLVGEVDEATLARELAQADAFVLPSSLEGYGIAATEAVRAGVPVIAARSAALAESLAPAPGAVRFVDEHMALATAVRQVTTDATLRRDMRAAAERAHLPTWGEAADAFASLL